MSDVTKMTPPPMSAGRLCVCRSGAFYAQSAYNVLICASVLWLHLFLFWLAFEFEHDATPVWRDFALSRNAFLGLATLAPILFYMLWVDGVLVPVFVVVWAALAPVGFNLHGSGDVLNPPSCLVLLMWPGKFLLGGSTVMAAFLFLSELSIALPFCLRYFFFGLPRELIACLGHGFLRLLSVVLRGCCCGGRGAYVRPPYSRLMGLEKRKNFSGNGASWVRCLDVDRYETEGSALSCCEERVGQGDGSYHGEVLRPVEGRKNSGHLTQSEHQDEAPEKSHHIEEKTPAVLGWVLWERLLREVVRRQDVFMYDSALRYSKTLESATKDTDLEMVPPKKADPVEGKGEPVFERLHSNMARVHRIDEQRRCEIKNRQLLAGNQCCAGSPCFCARMVQVVTTILELLLLPMLLVPFALERVLFRYVDESGRESCHSHYIVMLHGMAHNSAIYLYARYFFALHGFTTNIIYINWNEGPLLLSYSGNVEKITENVVAQVRERLKRIQARRRERLAGSRRRLAAQKGSSIGNKSLSSRLKGRENQDPPAAHDDAEDDQERITVSLVGHSCGGLLTVQLASRLFGVGEGGAHDPAAEKDALHETYPRTEPVSPSQKLRTSLPLQNVELYSIASVSGPFGGSDFILLLYRSFPKSVVKGIVDGSDALYVDLLPRSEQTANLSRTLARILACRGETTHLRGGAHFFAGSADVQVYPYSAFGLMFPMDYTAASAGGVGEGQALENYPADVALDSVAENTSFALLTNLGHHNIAVSATLWRSVLSRVVREVQ